MEKLKKITKAQIPTIQQQKKKEKKAKTRF